MPEKQGTLEARRERLEWGREQTRRELERAKLVREAEVRSITLAIETLEGFTTDFLERYTDRSAPPDPINYRMWLIEWHGQFGEGIVPEPFKGGRLEHDPGKARDLLYFALIVGDLRMLLRPGMDWAVTAARYVEELKEAELDALAHEIEGESDEAERYRQDSRMLMGKALGAYDRAVPDLLDAFRRTLGLLSSMNPEHLIFGAKEYRRRREQAKKAYRQAVVELFRRIIEREGETELSAILYWAGTGYYKRVEVDGNIFVFEKKRGELVISIQGNHDEAQVIRRQNIYSLNRYSSTLYDWRKDALKALQPPA